MPTQAERHTTPSPRTAIVTLATDDYWNGARVLFRSLEACGLPDYIDRIVLSNDPAEPDWATRRPISHDYSEIKSADGQFALTPNKLFALTLDYDRIIIIDADIFCVQDCKFLWSNNLSALPFYAVADCATTIYYGQRIDQLGLDRNLMFNAGTMVYNRGLLPDLHEQLLWSITNGSCQSYDGGDQGYFNAYFQGIRQEIGYLPVGYNYLPDPNMPRIPPHARYLFHFAGEGPKPWSPGYSRDLGEYSTYLDAWQKHAR